MSERLSAGAPKRDIGQSVINTLNTRLDPMTMDYLHIKFSDDTVARVTFEHNTAMQAAQWPRLKVQALVKIDGRWNAPEDWSGKDEVHYCRDKRAERIEELVLIYSNSHAGDQPFEREGPSVVALFDDDHELPKLEISNAACMPWHGTSSVISTNALGGRYEQWATVTYKEFEPDDNSALKAFVVESGIATVEESWIDESGWRQLTARASGPIAEIDSRLYFDLDRRIATGTGISTIQNTTHTLECPGADPIIVPGPAPAQWLRLPLTGAELGEDGRTLKGSFSETNAVTGVTTTSTWDLTAQREE